MRAGIFLTICTGAAIAAAGANATGLKDAEITLAYGMYDVDGLDDNITVWSFGARADYAINESFGVQVGAGHNRYNYDDNVVDLDFDATAVQAFGYFDAGSGLKAGVSLGYLNLGDVDFSFGGTSGSFDIDGDATIYGAGVIYDAGAFALEGQIGEADVDIDGVDATYFLLGADYAINSSIEVFGLHENTNIDVSGVGDEDIRSTSIGIKYYVLPSAHIQASVGNTSALDEDVTSLNLGLTWTLGGRTKDATTNERMFTTYDSPF